MLDPRQTQQLGTKMRCLGPYDHFGATFHGTVLLLPTCASVPFRSVSACSPAVDVCQSCTHTLYQHVGMHREQPFCPEVNEACTASFHKQEQSGCPEVLIKSRVKQREKRDSTALGDFAWRSEEQI